MDRHGALFGTRCTWSRDFCTDVRDVFLVDMQHDVGDGILGVLLDLLDQPVEN